MTFVAVITLWTSAFFEIYSSWNDRTLCKDAISIRFYQGCYATMTKHLWKKKKKSIPVSALEKQTNICTLLWMYLLKCVWEQNALHMAE